MVGRKVQKCQTQNIVSSLFQACQTNSKIIIYKTYIYYEICDDR